MKFIKTQGLNKTISDPKDIDIEYLDKKELSSKLSNLNKKIKVLNRGEEKKKDKPRKIAIFTDAHALYEPTLAVLEDARKNGVDEIYSLGDNIGSGPSPKEVMDLLKEYGVKSVKGNHELYALGIEKLPQEIKRHLNYTKALDEAKRNSEYTRSKLTSKQLKEISNYPDSIDLSRGGKKIKLTHYSKAYDTREDKIIPEDVNEVFEGHIHKPSSRQRNKTKITTVGGLGVRQGMIKPRAYYMILSETDNGYESEIKEIEYNSSNLKHTINESGLNDLDKNKIKEWSRVK